MHMCFEVTFLHMNNSLCNCQTASNIDFYLNTQQLIRVKENRCQLKTFRMNTPYLNTVTFSAISTDQSAHSVRISLL